MSAQLGELQDLAQQVLDGIRQRSRALHPVVLDDFGLEHAHWRNWVGNQSCVRAARAAPAITRSYQSSSTQIFVLRPSVTILRTRLATR